MKHFLIVTLFALYASADLNKKVAEGEQMTAFEFGELVHQVKVAGQQDLLGKAQTKLGVKSEAEIQQIIRLCPTLSDDAVLGHFVPYSVGQWTQKSEPNGVFELANSTLNTRTFVNQKDKLSQKVNTGPGFFFIEIEKKPTICIRSDLTLGRATLTFIHELTHWVGYELHENLPITRFTNHNQFVDYMLTRKGGEVEAVRNQVAAAEKLSITDSSLNIPNYCSLSDKAAADTIRERYSRFYSHTFANLVTNMISHNEQEVDFTMRVISNLETRRNQTPEQQQYLEQIAAYQASLREKNDSLIREYSGYIAK